MNRVYPSAVDHFLQGDIDVDTDTIAAVLVTNAYEYDETHTFLGDVPPEAVVGTPVNLTITSVEGGEVEVDPVTFVAVPAGDTVTGVIITVASADAWMIAYISKRADTVPISIDTNDGDITLSWPRLFRI